MDSVTDLPYHLPEMQRLHPRPIICVCNESSSQFCLLKIYHFTLDPTFCGKDITFICSPYKLCILICSLNLFLDPSLHFIPRNSRWCCGYLFLTVCGKSGFKDGRRSPFTKPSIHLHNVTGFKKTVVYNSLSTSSTSPYHLCAITLFHVCLLVT